MFYRGAQNTYTTNPVGFYIVLLYAIMMVNKIGRYRRNRILAEKKRFVYQQYLRKKFIEESLRLKESKKLEYKDYFIQ